MKCFNCGEKFSPNKKTKEVQVAVDNPGVLSVKGQVFDCPGCHTEFAEEQDMTQILSALGKECEKHHHSD